MKILFVGEGKNDWDVVPILVKNRAGGRLFEESKRKWLEFRTNGKSGFKKKLGLALLTALRDQYAGVVATLDGDNDPKGRKDQLMQGRNEWLQKNPNSSIAIGVAIPELEAWLLDDHNAVKAGLGLPATTKIDSPAKCKDVKIELNHLIGDRARRDALVAIAEKVRLESSRDPAATGLKDFLEEVSENLPFKK